MRLYMTVMLSAVIWLSAVPSSRAAFFTVDTTTNAGDVLHGDGLCATATGECALLAAIQETNALEGADAIIVPAGNYDVSKLIVADAVVIGGAGAEATIINGDGTDTVIVSSTDLALLDLTVTGGAGTNVGGGIQNNGGRLTLINCSVRDNTTENAGAGIYSDGGALTVIGSTIHGNEAGNVGGGIHTHRSLLVIGSTIDNNFAFNSGGGIHARGSTTVENSTISGNWVINTGGGISNGGNLKMRNCTVTLNAAANTPGAGIDTSTEHPTQLSLENTVVANNRQLNLDLTDPLNPQLVDIGPAVDCDSAGQPVAGSHNLVQWNSGYCAFTSGDNLSGADAQLGPLQDNGGPTFTHALLSGSAAIDAGNPAPPGSGGGACLATDQRGVARPYGAACDIGAFEVSPCGDATLDAGEECDDGNGADGDGCDSNCTLTGCGNGITTAGEECDDGNLEDGDCCSSSCELTIDEDLLSTPPGEAKVLLREQGKGRLRWKWKGPQVMAPEDFGDPTDATTYTLCLVDESGAAPSLVMTAQAPAGGICKGKPCWRRTPSGFRYRGDLQGPGRVSSVKLRTSAKGTTVLVIGKGRRLRVGRLPLVLPLRVVLRRSDATEAFGAAFGGARRNRLDQFQATSD